MKKVFLLHKLRSWNVLSWEPPHALATRFGGHVLSRVKGTDSPPNCPLPKTQDSQYTAEPFRGSLLKWPFYK